MDEKLENIKKAVGDLVKIIIGEHKKVSVISSEKNNPEKGEFTLIIIRVEAEDIPKCIGIKGMIAESIRNLAVEVAKNNGYTKKIFIRVNAPNFVK